MKKEYCNPEFAMYKNDCRDDVIMVSNVEGNYWSDAAKKDYGGDYKW